jgi:hypothetical protein
VAIAAQEQLFGCDGFRVESPEGLLGWVEETWIGPSREPTALAVRTLDGRRGLLVAEDVERVNRDHDLVVMDGNGRLLELDVPRVVTAASDGNRIVQASWETTGETLEPPDPPGVLQRALLVIRPWRLAPPPQPGADRPLWQQIAVLYTVLAVIVLVVIGLAFLIARLAAGVAY